MLSIADFGDGDQVLVNGKRYRLMIAMRGGYMAREWIDGGWSHVHRWISDTAAADEIERMPVRRKGRKQNQDQQDPMQWRGTQKGML